MDIRPLGDRILLIRQAEEQKTAGGIIIPDTAREKPQQGTVTAVGPGKRGKDGKRTPLSVKAGDRVLFSRYAGSDIKIDGKEHVFLREDDVLGIVN